MQGKKRLLWQLYPAFLFIGLISIIPVTWYATNTLEAFFLKQTSDDLAARAHMTEDRILPLLEPLDEKAIDALCKSMGKRANTRITVISPAGRVYGDSLSDPSTMDNHRERPEVVAAFSTGRGHSLRFSKTLQKKLMYLGIAVRRNNRPVAVVRTSIPVETINEVISGIQGKIALAALLIALISAGLSFIVSRRISRPMEVIRRAAESCSIGNFDAVFPATNIEEIEKVSTAMKEMAAGIRDRVETITRQHNELEAVLGSMLEGVIAIDLEGHILSINGAAARLFDTRRLKAPGMTIEELARNTRLSRFVEKALQKSDSIREDIPIRTGDGDRVLNARSTSLMDSRGGRIGILLVMEDVTRIRELENMRRDFVANVSHEIKTPITAIKGFVETLTDSAMETGDARRFLGIIQKHTHRLEAIIDDLLSLSRIERESEDTEIIREKSNIGEVLESAVQLCRVKTGARGVQVKVDCPQNLTVAANAHLLEQALVNLLDNAIRYSPAGEEILLKARSDGEVLEISVSDNGCGIAPEHIPRLFERFYRVDKGRSRSNGGTGLGLAIVKHIVQVHRGEITVCSDPGKGSTFTIRLPGNRHGDGSRLPSCR